MKLEKEAEAQVHGAGKRCYAVHVSCPQQRKGCCVETL